MTSKYKHKIEGCVLLYGASGSIGAALLEALLEKKHAVWCVSSSLKTDRKSKVVALGDVNEKNIDVFGEGVVFDHVIFAQGLNINDDVGTFNIDQFLSILTANVTTILMGISYLLKRKMLASGGSITIISSIWQERARSRKLSYSVSKSALKGVVMSLVSDLSEMGIRINAVLPGPIDNPMTRANLTDPQIKEFAFKTPMRRLVKVDEVLETILFLMSTSASGITSNFIKLDLGFSDVETFEN